MTPKVVDKEARKKEIAALSLELFAQRGFDATSMSQIAEAVGVKKATLYDYFSSKDDLILEALQVWMEHVTEGWESQIEQLKDPVQQIQVLSLGAIEMMQSPLATQLTLAATQLLLKEETGHRFYFIRELLMRVRRQFGGVLLEGISQGVFRAEIARHTDTIAVNLLAYLDGLGLHYALLGEHAFSPEEQVTYYTERLLADILTEKTKQEDASKNTEQANENAAP
ncbi:MAG: TetR/AcrR family transcriptional regulator [Deltaproteobacteria bacterium]|nr:MAG: TetR/AcrR family transcriptional regulator [Deltaproteobacteria bacterium]